MRLGSRTPDKFIELLNDKIKSIQSTYLCKITELTDAASIKVMMGDATVTEQKTFDPKNVSDYFQRIDSMLKEWSLQDISTTNNQDTRRIFTKFEIKEGNYVLSGHLSLQFHVLLYYTPTQRVIDCQKELADIIDMTKNTQAQFSDNSDQTVLDKLKEMGYKDFDHQKLFEVFYENDEFREKVFAEIQKDAGVNFQELAEKKTKLFSELDSLLIETYQTSPVLIDDSRLVSGEEGCLLTLDIEFLKNNSRDGVFDPRKMPDAIKENIKRRIKELDVAVS